MALNRASRDVWAPELSSPTWMGTPASGGTGPHHHGQLAHDDERDPRGVPAEIADAAERLGLGRRADVSLEERVVGLEGEGGLDERRHRADPIEPGLDLGHPKVVHEHDAVHELDARVGACLDHLLRCAHVRRDRLLAQDVLAGAGRFDHDLATHAGRQRHVDGIDLGIGQHRLVAAVGSIESVLLGEDCGTIQRPARDGDRTGMSRALHATDDLAGDPGGPDDAPATCGCGSAHDVRLPEGANIVADRGGLPAGREGD